jgi:hypothetical protein
MAGSLWMHAQVRVGIQRAMRERSLTCMPRKLNCSQGMLMPQVGDFIGSDDVVCLVNIEPCTNISNVAHKGYFLS